MNETSQTHDACFFSANFFADHLIGSQENSGELVHEKEEEKEKERKKRIWRKRSQRRWFKKKNWMMMKMIRKDYTAFLGLRLVSGSIFQVTLRYKFIVWLLNAVKRIEGCRPFPGLDLFLLLQLMLSTHTEKVLYSQWLFITRSANDCEHSLYRPVKDTSTMNAWSNASWLCSLQSIQVCISWSWKKKEMSFEERKMSMMMKLLGDLYSLFFDLWACLVLSCPRKQAVELKLQMEKFQSSKYLFFFQRGNWMDVQE